MFRNLRLKLTLINVAVLGVIFLFFFSGIYFLVTKNIFRQSEQVMNLIASDAGSGNFGKIAEREKHWPKPFYVKINDSGTIIETSPYIPVDKNQLHFLIQQAATAPQPRATIVSDDESYRFLKVPMNNYQGETLVFVRSDMEGEFLNRFMAALTMTGLIGLALAFFGSLFMADRALVPIKKSWQRQKNFVADASHELRTPLAVIQTNLELIIGNSEETVASQAKWLENIHAENKRMTKLVSDLLLLARADSQQDTLDMKQFELPLALQEAVSPFEPMAEARGIKIQLFLESPVIFCGDETRIKQLVVILIDNAVKHTPNGGQINLTLKRQETGVEIVVADTGEGIAKEHLGKIFERFYRVDKSRSRSSGSSGLGLSIAEWIVKEHRGTIRVNSTPGKGTTFVIHLPIN